MSTNASLACTRNYRLLYEHRKYLERYSPLGPKTVNARMVQARRLIDYLGPECILELTEERLWEFRQSLSSLALRTRIDTLHATRDLLLGVLSKHGASARFKAQHVDALKPKHHEERGARAKKPIEFPKESDILKVVSGLMDAGDPIAWRDAAIIALMVQTGVRVGSLITLRGKDLQLNEEKRILDMDPREVHTKFSKYIRGRVFKFDPAFDDAILAYLRYRKERLRLGSLQPLFTKGRTSRPGSSEVVLSSDAWTNPSSPSRIIADRFEAEGLPRFPAHRLRHAAAHMAMGRASSAFEIKAIAQSFGHSTTSLILGTYGDFSDSQLDEIIVRIGTGGTGLSAKEEQLIGYIRQLNNP